MQLFQGEKPARDFLSLHTGGGASSPVQHSTQAAEYDLGVHNTLKLAKPRGSGAIAMASVGLEADSEEHVLPSGGGTFSIRQVPSAQSRGEAESGARAHSGPSTMWQDSGTDQRSRTPKEGRSSGSSADQGPSTPRSKHSATEQRRRTKINDRLEILRELLPHGDQKRDKASFLLEVIEYIRFLQEKVQKYESANPDRNHEDSKSMPWAKVYYRSCWKKTQNISQVQGGELSPSVEDVNNEPCGSKTTTVAPGAIFGTQSIRETSTDVSPSQKVANTAQIWERNSTPSKQPPWLSISTSDSGNRPLSTNETTVHEDTRSISNAYSQGLLHRLTEALKRSGVDPSQANISVEINMDRRDREHDNAQGNSKNDEGDECNYVAKRLKCDTS